MLKLTSGSYNYQSIAFILFMLLAKSGRKKIKMRYKIEIYKNRERFNEQYQSIDQFLLEAEKLEYNEHFHWGRFEWMHAHSYLDEEKLISQGLAKAVIYEACARAKALGAKRAIVVSEQEFYFRIGFTLSSEVYDWTRNN